MKRFILTGQLQSLMDRTNDRFENEMKNVFSSEKRKIPSKSSQLLCEDYELWIEYLNMIDGKKIFSSIFTKNQPSVSSQILSPQIIEVDNLLLDGKNYSLYSTNQGNGNVEVNSSKGNVVGVILKMWQSTTFSGQNFILVGLYDIVDPKIENPYLKAGLNVFWCYDKWSKKVVMNSKEIIGHVSKTTHPSGFANVFSNTCCMISLKNIASSYSDF